MATENEIDLYENIDDEFQDLGDATDDLYDDVISNKKPDIILPKQELSIRKESEKLQTHTGKKVTTYVGNLSWWTRDVDLIYAAQDCGIYDVLEVKFHENRQNGQSKGFCVMVFGSDQSAQMAIDRLTKVEVHGQKPIIKYCSRASLAFFENMAHGGSGSGNSQSNQNQDSQQQSRPQPLFGSNNSGNSNKASGGSRNQTSSNAHTFAGQANNAPGPNQTAIINPNQNNPHILMLLKNLLPANVLNSLPKGGAVPQNSAPSVMLPSTGMGPGGNMGTAPHVNPNVFSNAPAAVGPSLLGPANLYNSSASNYSGQVAMNGNPLHMLGNMGSGNVGSQGINTMYTNSNHFPAVNAGPSNMSRMGGVPIISNETEFEEIFSRNKAVATSAINRARKDADCQDYQTAIATLTTAISLINQSKIANDPRCRVLIDSLQQTLRSIESNSYRSSRRRQRSFSSVSDDCGSVERFDDRRAPRDRRERRSRSRDADRRRNRGSNRRSRDKFAYDDYGHGGSRGYRNRR